MGDIAVFLWCGKYSAFSNTFSIILIMCSSAGPMVFAFICRWNKLNALLSFFEINI